VASGYRCFITQGLMWLGVEASYCHTVLRVNMCVELLSVGIASVWGAELVESDCSLMTLLA
jgi:hypothetical protein